VARPDPGAERGQAAHERPVPAHGRPRGHLGDTQAPQREEAPVRAGGPGGISGVVHWQSPPDGDHLYRFVLCGLRVLRALREVLDAPRGGRVDSRRHSQRPGGNVRGCRCQGTVTVLMMMWLFLAGHPASYDSLIIVECLTRPG
jgi:hypothetical protein